MNAIPIFVDYKKMIFSLIVVKQQEGSIAAAAVQEVWVVFDTAAWSRVNQRALCFLRNLAASAVKTIREEMTLLGPRIKIVRMPFMWIVFRCG